MKLSERCGWLLAAVLGGAMLGGAVIALLDIGATLGELRCRIVPEAGQEVVASDVETLTGPAVESPE